MKIAVVRVEPTCQESELNIDDIEVAGEYEIQINEDTNEAQVADIALDVFHSNMAVEVLDDFTFTVLFNGVVVQPDPAHESYSYQHLGSM